MMKRLPIIFFVLISFHVFAQQQIQVSQYMLNQYVVNPAVGGTAEFVEAAAGYRAQWIGLEGSPRTFYMSVHSPIKKAPKHVNWKGKKNYFHGIGAYVNVDQIGLLSRTSVYGSYAYNMGINKKIRWSTGMFLGFQQHRIDGSGIVMKGFDNALPDYDINKMMPDVTLGTWLYSADWYAGISSTQILRNRLDYSVDNPNSGEIGRLKSHFFITAGTRIPFYHKEFEWIPSIMVKKVHPAPFSIDLNSKFKYKKMYWAGVSYRSNDALVFLLGITVAKSLHIGYSFDAPITDLRKYQGTSHEFVIGYSFLRNYDVWSPQMFW